MFVGLTGGIACGKSTAADLFRHLSWQVFDADAFCRSLYERRAPEIMEPLLKRWGQKILDSGGFADRKKIAAIVFNDKNELEWVNNIFHPLVFKEGERLREKTPGQYLLFDAPLIFEAARTELFDCIITIWADRRTQIVRLGQRGLSVQESEERINAQLDASVKLEKADYGLINTGSKGLLLEQITNLNSHIRNLTHGK